MHADAVTNTCLDMSQDWFTHAIFCAIFVALFNAIFVTLKLVIKIASVNLLQFQFGFCAICCHDVAAVLPQHVCNQERMKGENESPIHGHLSMKII